MVAPGTTAPEESRTVPVSVAVTEPCADALCGSATSPISRSTTAGSAKICNLISISSLDSSAPVSEDDTISGDYTPMRVRFTTTLRTIFWSMEKYRYVRPFRPADGILAQGGENAVNVF